MTEFIDRRRAELAGSYPSDLVDRAIELGRVPTGDDTLQPGEVAEPVPVKEAELTKAFRAALTPKGTPNQVVWHHRGSECALALDKTRVKVIDGFVVVGLTLTTAETGPQELTVPFAVGSEDRLTGLLTVTERRPRGHPSLVRTWSEGVIALAWRTLLEVADVVSAISGTDIDGRPLRAGALVASEGVLRVIPQARHDYERPHSKRPTVPGPVTQRLGIG